MNDDGFEFCRKFVRDRYGHPEPEKAGALADLLEVAELTVEVIDHLRAFSNVTPYIGDAVINELEAKARAAIRRAGQG